jgi:hypothetical protein
MVAVSTKRIVELLLKDFPSGLNMNNMTEIIIESMKIVGAVKDMSGKEKKSLVIESLFELFNQTDAGTYDKEIDLMLITTVPIIIDNLVSAENGDLTINPIIKSCLTSCIPKLS